MSELLDDEIKNENPINILELLPLIVIALFFLLSTFHYFIWYLKLNFIDYFGYLLAIIAGFFYTKSKKVYFYIISAVLILNLFSITNWSFSPFITYSFSINSMTMSFDLITFFLFIYHIIIFRKEIDIKINNENSTDKSIPNKNNINRLKRNFGDKTHQELLNIIESESFRDEAKIAAKELLDRKHNG